MLRAALREDLGDAGDITTTATIPAGAQATGRVVARDAGTIAGLRIALEAFALLGGEPSGSATTGSETSGSAVSGGGVTIDVEVEDGARVEAGTTLAHVHGSARTLLTGERTCLNLLGHLSGIATATQAVVDAVEGLDVRVADTRKTTPGLRALEKYAVRCGGGVNHRFGLHDAAMIKDNHLVAAGSITAAVAAVRASVGHTVRIELEVDRIDQLPEALDAGVDIVLLDNMDAAQLREAVALIDGRAITEASGRITPTGARELAATGVNVLSLGWITHSAPRLDVALDLA